MAIYLITGTTRGIGLGLVSSLLLRPSTTIIAGVRDSQSSAADALTKLPKASGTSLIIVKLDATNPDDPKNAVELLQKHHGITHLDVVIANAGIADMTWEPIASISLSTLRTHLEVNTFGPLLLFQATRPLLLKAQAPKFVVTSTVIGSLTIAPSFTLEVGNYGVSKAAVNYLFRKASGEEGNEGICFGLVHPGLVESDMSAPLVQKTGRKPISVEESVKGFLEVVDEPASELAGKFYQYDGEELPW